MIISKGIYIKRNLILLGLSAMMFLTSLGYFLGWEIEMATLLIYILVIVLEVFVAIVVFIILNKTNSKFYKFDMDKIVYLITKDRKSTRLNSSHVRISYAVFCLKKKKKKQ